MLKEEEKKALEELVAADRTDPWCTAVSMDTCRDCPFINRNNDTCGRPFHERWDEAKMLLELHELNKPRAVWRAKTREELAEIDSGWTVRMVAAYAGKPVPLEAISNIENGETSFSIHEWDQYIYSWYEFTQDPLPNTQR